MPTPPRPTPRSKPRKSELTRTRLLDRALALFRKKGFAETTMRDIADAAELAPGAAYYYFPSKEAILFAFYQRTEVEHEARVGPALAEAPTLRARLGMLMHEKLRAVSRERKLLGALVQRLADPADPISAFAPETRSVRDHAMALFARAFAGEPFTPELVSLALPSLWMLHLGFMLYFVHDRSREQQKTHQLVDDLLDLVVPLLYLGATPMLAPMIAQLGKALGNAGLVAGFGSGIPETTGSGK